MQTEGVKADVGRTGPPGGILLAPGNKQGCGVASCVGEEGEMQTKWGEGLGATEVMLCGERCIHLAPGTKIGCSWQDAPLGLVLVSAGHHFLKVEHAEGKSGLWVP